jgi:hypothetical protein
VVFRSLGSLLFIGALVACAGSTMTTTSTMKLPTGAWQRDWIHRRGAAQDASVAVRYVQTPSVFADVRTAAVRAIAAGATSFADLGDDELAALARQNGFAGVTTLAGDRATWHHEIDFQPPSDDVDIGRIEPTGPGAMFEHALDGAYVERWSAIAPDAGPYLAVRVTRGGRVAAILAVAGDHFVYARARATPLPAADSIPALIAANHATRDMIIGYLDCEISYGTTRGWRIERSTLPWREGQRAVIADALTVRDGRVVARAPAADETWQVAESTFTSAALAALFAP